jgi:hypothetical protein
MTGFLLSDPAAIPLLTAAYVASGIVLVLTDYTLNNEGLLTHYSASWARRDFLPVFFFQKVRPVLCALYAAISAGGPRATLVAHVAVAAMAIPMMAATARSLGHRLPNLPALAVALSPVYFYGGPAGLSNVDGVVGIALVLYLLCARRLPLAAALVAGLLPWIRFELATFSAVMALYLLATEGERSTLFGMVVFPFAYIGAGALYHHDALWIVHFPPSAPFDPGNPIYQGQLIGLRYLLEPALALTPAVALVAGFRLGRLRRIERALLAYAVLTLVAMNVLPIFRIGNFGDSPRYSLHALPALALLIGRALDPWWDGERPGFTSLLGTALLGVWVATREPDGHPFWILMAVYTLILAAAWLRAGTVAAALTAALILAGPLFPFRTSVIQKVVAPYLDPMSAWLKAHPELRARPIYTNAQLLAPFLERYLPGASVYHMAGIDMARDLNLLTNPDNGQRARIRQLCASDLYGKTLFPPFTPEDLPGDALLALRMDPRLPLLLPSATWSSRLELLVETPTFRIARIRPAAAAAGP